MLIYYSTTSSHCYRNTENTHTKIPSSNFTLLHIRTAWLRGRTSPAGLTRKSNPECEPLGVGPVEIEAEHAFIPIAALFTTADIVEQKTL